MSGPRTHRSGNEQLPLLVATLPSRRAVEAVARSALERETIHLTTHSPPVPGTRYTLQLSCPQLREPLSIPAEGTDSGALRLLPLERESIAGVNAFLWTQKLLPEAEPDDEADPFVGRLLGSGKYEIERLISSGSAGLVYRGRHLLLDRFIAIKVLHAALVHDPMFTAHFNGEARAASRLDHPNICRVFDFGQDDDGLLYIVMELLEGRELGEVVYRDGPLPVERIVDYMVQVCGALSLAHDRGIVHRDVKSENILACPSKDDDDNRIEVVKVCDFGLAMSTDLRAEQFATHRGACGTPQYMPPEQVRGEALDASADVYACGVLMYLLATGKLPFDDEDTRRVLAMQLKAQPVAPTALEPCVDPGLEAIILRSMSKARKDRFANGRELRTALRALVASDKRAWMYRTGGGPAISDSARVPVSQPASSTQSPDSRRPARRLTPPRAPRPLATAVDALNCVMSSEGTDIELYDALFGLVSGRGQICIFRADGGESDLMAQGGSADPRPLTDGCAAAAAERLSMNFSQRGIVSLSLREGLDRLEAQQLAGKLFAARVSSLASPYTTVITDHARLGRHRALSWRLDVAATQIAFALKMGYVAPPARMLALEAALRTVRAANEARVLLESSDLIAAATEISPWEVACAIGGALTQPVCTQLVSTLASEHSSRPGAVPLDLLRMLARRLASERTSNSDELLRDLSARSLLAAEDVPRELRVDRGPEQCAAALLSSPTHALAALESANDIATYGLELALIEDALKLLQRTGRLAPFAECIRILSRHAKDIRRPFRVALAPRVLSLLTDVSFLERLALVLLRGREASHDVAQSVLVATEEAGVNALVSVRLKVGCDVDFGGRKRFVAAVRACGLAATGPLTHAFARVEVHDATISTMEDLLRAVPERAGGEIDIGIAKFVQHRSPRLRRAALGALVAVAGRQALPTLNQTLWDEDDSVVLAALVLIGRLGRVDAALVARLQELLSSGGEEQRIAAAEALASTSSSAQPEAISVLMRALTGKGTWRIVPRGDETESVAVIEAVSRSLLKLAGGEARRAVERRMERGSVELRHRLSVLLTRV